MHHESFSELEYKSGFYGYSLLGKKRPRTVFTVVKRSFRNGKRTEIFTKILVVPYYRWVS